jgi:hypothetical protein
MARCLEDDLWGTRSSGGHPTDRLGSILRVPELTFPPARALGLHESYPARLTDR